MMLRVASSSPYLSQSRPTLDKIIGRDGLCWPGPACVVRCRSAIGLSDNCPLSSMVACIMHGRDHPGFLAQEKGRHGSTLCSAGFLRAAASTAQHHLGATTFSLGQPLCLPAG